MGFAEIWAIFTDSSCGSDVTRVSFHISLVGLSETLHFLLI